MTVGRTIQTWGGHNINDDNPFAAHFLSDSGDPGTYESQAVEVTRAGAFPVHAYGQPQAKTIEVEIEIVGNSSFADAWKDLQSWFDPALGRQYLIALDADSNQQRLLCFPQRLDIAGGEAGTAGNVITVTLRAALPVWEDVNADTDEEDVGTGGGDVVVWDVDNDGNTRTPFQIAITPSVAKDPGDSWPTRRRVVIANRSERALEDPVSDGYPVLLCDLDDLTITPGNDIRVVLNGEFIPHWLEGSLLWVNLSLRPRKTATLAAGIDDNDLTLSVSNTQGFERDRWPQQGFFFIEDEAIQYTARDADEMTIVRGALGTTAASHAADAVLYWIQFPYLSLLYGFTDADAPSGYTDTKPVIDLAASTNVSHVWPDTFFTSERNSRAFQRRFSDLGVGSQHIRQYGDGTSLVYENNQAVAGKPNQNDAVIDFPVPAEGPFELDENVELTMLLRGYVADSEGYESRLIDQPFSDGLLSAQSFAVPDIVQRLRLTGSVGVVVGHDGQTAWPTFTAGATIPETYQRTAVRFQLTQQTKIIKLAIPVAQMAGATGDLRLYIMEDNGEPQVDEIAIDSDNDGVADQTRYRQHVLGGAFIANADLPTAAGGPLDWLIVDMELQLEAGSYWLSLYRLIGDTGNFLVAVGTAGFVTFVEGAINPQEGQIAFLLITDETEPQEDAPLDNGDVIEMANLTAPLDATRAPKIVIGDEEEIYLLDARLQNDDTEDYLDLFFLLPIGNTLLIDADTHSARDSETGLSVPWAVRPSNPERFIDLLAGDNDFSWTETGPTGLTVATSWRPRRL